MSIQPGILIDGQALVGQGDVVRGVDPATMNALEPGFGSATAEHVEMACAAAWSAFRPYRALAPTARADFLDAIAVAIEAIGDDLIVTAMAETALPRPRLEGERGRTCTQLRLFATMLRSGEWAGVRIDPALPERKPLPRVDLRMRHIGLGPVAVFAASNFPLAFSVAGGDTASALAAGCPVVVKAHSSHPGTSMLVGKAVQAAVKACGLPAGVFSLLLGAGRVIGAGLIEDPRIKAVGFTGSRQGGLALLHAAQARPEPIPVYAEMSSINPVILFPHALKARAAKIASDFAASLTLGVGQFCTNPGLLVAVEGEGLDAFRTAAAEALAPAGAATMLNETIHKAYVSGVAALETSAEVRGLAQGAADSGPNQARAALYGVDADRFLANPELGHEVFGPCSLLVSCRSEASLADLLETLEGQLTVALHIEPEDYPLARALLPIIEEKAGRVLVNGFGTGVEVAHSMVHGGPYPATSDTRSTSVGTLAIDRFLRPVCYQDLPDAIQSDDIRDDNPLGLPRLVDGKRS